jgi:hypothetical protein
LRKQLGFTPEAEDALQALERAEKANAPAQTIQYLKDRLSFELGMIEQEPALPAPDDLAPPPKPDKPEEPTRLLADQRQPKPELPNSPAEPIEESVEPEQPPVKNKGGGQDFWDGEKLRDWLEQQKPPLRFGTIELFMDRIRERIEPKPGKPARDKPDNKRYGLLFTGGSH